MADANRALSAQEVEDERMHYTAETRYTPPKCTRPDRAYGYRRVRMARRQHPYGSMKIVDTAPYGRLRFRCFCGWTGWNIFNLNAPLNQLPKGFGPAGEHAKACPFSDKEP